MRVLLILYTMCIQYTFLCIHYLFTYVHFILLITFDLLYYYMVICSAVVRVFCCLSDPIRINRTGSLYLSFLTSAILSLKALFKMFFRKILYYIMNEKKQKFVLFSDLRASKHLLD